MPEPKLIRLVSVIGGPPEIWLSMRPVTEAKLKGVLATAVPCTAVIMELALPVVSLGLVMSPTLPTFSVLLPPPELNSTSPSMTPLLLIMV